MKSLPNSSCSWLPWEMYLWSFQYEPKDEADPPDLSSATGHRIGEQSVGASIAICSRGLAGRRGPAQYQDLRGTLLAGPTWQRHHIHGKPRCWLPSTGASLERRLLTIGPSCTSSTVPV